jgi:nitroreductase
MFPHKWEVRQFNSILLNFMDFFKTLENRRSIRSFLNKKVEAKKITKILNAGLIAPSSKNSQPWKFFVIQNKKLIEKLGDILVKSKNLQAEPSDPKTGKIRAGFKSSIYASGEIIKKAPVLIVIENTCPFSGNRQAVRRSKYSNSINGHDSELISLGAAIENMSLATIAQGLSSVIICDCIAEEGQIKKILKIKGDLIGILPIGYPAYKPGPRRLELKDKIKYL